MSDPQFNPALPVDHSPIVAAELRTQLNGLDRLIAQCAPKPYYVAPLSLIVSNPPTQAEVATIANKIDELIAALQVTAP